MMINRKAGRGSATVRVMLCWMGATVLMAGCAGSTGPGAAAIGGAPGEARRFTILQVNDVYRIEGLEGGRIGGLARIRTLREELERNGPVLLLHGGDALFPSVMSKYLDGKPMIDALNRLDGDPDAFDPFLLLTFGNHEFDPSTDEVLRARLPESDFRWVTSNIYYRPEAEGRAVPFNRVFPNVHHWVLLDIGALKVAVFGLTVDAAEKAYLDYDYDEKLRHASVRATLGALEELDPDVIIALTHQDMSEDQRLASEFPEIDLIVGGHDHLTQYDRVAGTLITKADADAKTAYVIDVDASDGVKAEARLVTLDEQVAGDAEMQRVVDDWLAELSRKLPNYTRVMGTTVDKLEGEEPIVRTRESAMGNWLADVVRERLNADIGLVQGGGIRINDNIPAGGDIRVADLEGIFYFDGDVVSFELSGSDIVEILENSVSKVHSGDGRFQQVSGLRFEYEVTRPDEGDPVYAIDPATVEIKAAGAAEYAPLDLTGTYTVATPKHLWDAGEKYGYRRFAEDTRPPLLQQPGESYDWRTITEDWLTQNGQVTVGIEGRIRRIERQMH